MEDMLIHQHDDKSDKGTSFSEYRQSRNYMSPYSKTSVKDTKRKRRSASARVFSSKSALASRLRSRDFSSTETNSVQSTNEASEVGSIACSSTTISGLKFLPKKKSSPSAPPFHLWNSHSYLSSSKHPVLRRQPCIIKVVAYKNGSRSVYARVAAPTMKMLLEECTLKLMLNSAARRVFLANGKEAHEPQDIPHGADVYISTGEPFADPLKKIKDHLSLSKEASWTINGIVFPNDAKRGRTKPSLSKRMRKLTAKNTIRLLVFKNGTGKDGCEVIAAVDQIEKFLDQCTVRLNLTSPARVLFDWDGKRIEDISQVPMLDSCLQNSITPLRGPIWVSKGEGFSPSGAKVYIQGVMWALHEKLKPSREYSEQLNWALDNCIEKITRKDILSLTTEDLYNNKEKVDNLIDELQAAIKKHKGQLFKLTPQLQAEEQQCAGYVYQHIKQLSTSGGVPQGLQLKVYENGQSTGGITVYLNRKEVERGCENNIKTMMDRLLQMIHQRLQFCTDYSPSGLNLFPTCLFDQHGQKIQNPLSLQNDQEVWVAYGEDYRSPYNPVVNVAFDRVIAVHEEDKTCVYKMPPCDVDLPAAYDKWEACIGFPENYNYTSQQLVYHQHITVDLHSHFLQLKEDPQVVMYASVTVTSRSKGPSPKKKDNETQMFTSWSLTHIWIVTKAGVFLSRAMPQLCLAADDHSITLRTKDGASVEAYKLRIQKRIKGCPYQQWVFGKDGHIHSMANSEFVLTYLEELNVREEVTQTEEYNHQGAWSAEHQKTDSSFANKVSGSNVSDTNQTQVSRPIDTQPMPSGAPVESPQLTVALVRKLEDKHPKATAQRWAIKHEGTAKVGQWKFSKVENPLWNKLTYMWPVLPNGDLNEEFNWPLEGSLIPHAPPLRKPSILHAPESHIHIRLRVLRNGEKDQTKAITTTGPDIANILRKNQKFTGRPKKKKRDQKKSTTEDHEEDSGQKIHRLEFQQFLERCTVILNLPFAARRLFDADGRELTNLKDTQRDQLVYVSCGEKFIDPKLSVAEYKKRIILSNLESDISLIRNYWAMHRNEGLVMQVDGELVQGAKLIVAECAVISEEENKEDLDEIATQEKYNENKSSEEVCKELEDSHTKAHRKMEKKYVPFKYPWQTETHHLSDDDNNNDENAVQNHRGHSFTNKDLYHKYKPLPLSVRSLPVHRQQFEFKDGYISNCKVPNLVVGVLGGVVQLGSEIHLVEKKPDDINQRWIPIEEDRTFHLMSNPGLVLAVAMPKIKPGDNATVVQVSGCPLVLQKYKAFSYGVANQKWGWISDIKVLSAFYSTQMDQEITAANQASLCTFTVSGKEELDQQGFFFYTNQSNTNTKITVCLACARALRGKIILTKLPPGISFSCATGCKKSRLNPSGPFKCLSVVKTDLFASEAENTLRYYEEILNSLRKETSMQTISQEISAARTQQSVKIMAYRNGAGYKDGQLIIATTMPMLLSMCTTRLELSSAACRLYTADGTPAFRISELMAWAVNECFLASNTEEQEENQDSELAIQQEDDTASGKLAQDIPETKLTEKSKSLKPAFKSKHVHITSETLDSLDETLLTLILRNPVDVWVSCGEPFLPLQAIEKKEQTQKQNWLHKEKALADLVKKRHKMRHLEGRRISAMLPCRMIPTKSPVQPVVVEGGWMEPSQEEVKLMEDIQNIEVHLAEVQNVQGKKQIHFVQNISACEGDLYHLPSVKRVLVFVNGGNLKEGVFAWGKSIEELLDSCTIKLGMRKPAQILYTVEGKEISSMDEIERDMLICASSGEPFMTTKAKKQSIEIRANYARVRKDEGPEATDIVVNPKRNPKVRLGPPTSFLALPPAENVFSSADF
ncbi:doublecortin domain-containing protein 1-like [Polypterus senegalus]|uniref:doublecortin domain-containing protein 1-like n=1 Tax=Polypterus senegalus TaxID=55291 RepID=UPI001962CB02|nr:doublecortin domain-containing protein 1-like [Polypterus senegalus]